MASKAYLGWQRLCNDDLFGATGKLATLWFDELILQLPSPDLLPSVVYGPKGSEFKPVAKDLLRIWKPIQSELPSYSFLSLPGNRFVANLWRSRWFRKTFGLWGWKNPWEHKNKELVHAAQEVTEEAIKRDNPGTSYRTPGFVHEVAWAGMGLIDSVNAWSALNALQACSFLADEEESAVVNKVFASKLGDKTFDRFPVFPFGLRKPLVRLKRMTTRTYSSNPRCVNPEAYTGVTQDNRFDEITDCA